MSEKDDSALLKLAADAVKALETKIDNALSEADAELLKGPSHIADSDTDAFGFHAEVPVGGAIPLVTDAVPNEEKPPE